MGIDNKDISVVADQNIKALNKKSMIEIIKNSFRYNIKQYTMAIALLSIWVILTILTDGTFITSRNLSVLFMQTCYIAILSVGIVFVMVAGHIDLSVGRLLGFTGAIAGALQVNYSLGTVPTIIITLIAGAIVGVWHGFWIAYRGVPAFIVTLASMLMFQGFSLGITGGSSLSPMNASFKAIGQNYIPKFNKFNINFLNFEFSVNDTSAIFAFIFVVVFIALDLRKRKIRKKYGFEVLPKRLQLFKIALMSMLISSGFSIMVNYQGIPYSVLVLLGIVLLYSFIANKTTIGRYVYAIGGNKEAAKLSGINIKRITMLIFINMGVLAAIASIVFSARSNSATSKAGEMFELDAIAAAVIGGTSTMGGEGTIIGAVIGALVMSSLDNGMSLMNVNSMYQLIVKGLILLLAVAIDIATRKKV
ncbi:MAG: sugar ABC transporter permease [Clostridiales bacterium]